MAIDGLPGNGGDERNSRKAIWLPLELAGPGAWGRVLVFLATGGDRCARSEVFLVGGEGCLTVNTSACVNMLDCVWAGTGNEFVSVKSAADAVDSADWNPGSGFTEVDPEIRARS